MSDIVLPRILIIDDNPAIHGDFRKILEVDDKASQSLDTELAGILGEAQVKVDAPPLAYRIDSAYQGREGLAFVRTALEAKDPYALAFVDIRMPPGWDGIETIQHIWEVDADIQMVICSAYSDYSWSETLSRLGQTDRLLILKKPFDNVEIRQLACALTKKWQLNQQIKFYINNLESLVGERTAALKATIESTTDGILVTNNQNKAINYNQNFITMWKLPVSLLQPGNIEQIIDYIAVQVNHPEVFKTNIGDIYAHPEADKFDVLECSEGRSFEYYSRPQRIKDKIIGRVFSFRDITNRKQMEEQLSYQATHDLLTGLPNRLLLTDRLQQAVANAKRFGDLIAVMFVDLDHFKQINDSLGHNFGDKVLQSLAQRLSSGVRESDTLARLGGDEFVVVLTALKSEEEALPIIQKFIKNMSEVFMIENHEIQLHMSIGIGMYPKNGTDAVTLLKNADAAMYRAKDLGRNNFQFYTAELHSHVMRRIELEEALQQALRKNEFTLNYQPILNLQTGQLVAVEALMSWRHPKLGLISPDEFIKLAEEAGLIFAIGEWGLRTACLQNKAWQDSGLPKIRMAVNLSANQVKHRAIINQVKQILEETKLEANFLDLELTETIFVENTYQAASILWELRELGVTLVIDDFGMGYSSLSYLKHFPVSTLKIDREFSAALQSDVADVAIVKAIITLAKNLNLKIIAEGVETKQQLEFFQKNLCDEVQGFYFSKAISAEECAKMLKAGEKFLGKSE